LPKRSKEGIQTDEMKVLHFLEQHVKENIDELAKKCGFSRQKISRIIKNLEEKKTIWGYAAITDDNAKNLKHFVLLVKRNTVPFDDSFKKELIFDKLDTYRPGVIIDNISLTHGQFDGIVCFYAPALIDAKILVRELFKRIGKYFDNHMLLESLFPIRKNGFKNPQIKDLVNFI
jgi:DNA-binding Lrp family transcriptional regulator